MRLITFPVHEDKTPAISGWSELTESVPHTGLYFGVLTGAASGLFVLDVDMKKGKNGVAELDRLGQLPPTCTVKTPTGGLHFYFQHPGFEVQTNHDKLAPGLDIRGDKNGYVVGPGSPGYELIDDRDPAEAPVWLLERMRGFESGPAVAPDRAEPITEQHPDFLRRVELAKAWLQDLPPCMGGTTQDFTWLFGQTLSGDLELPLETSMALIQELYAPYCYPHWWAKCGHEVERALDRARLEASNGIRSLSQTAAIVPRRIPGAPVVAAPNPQPVAAQPTKEATPGSWAQSMNWDEPVPPVEWLIDRVIVDSQIHALVAAGGKGKTWVALSMAIAVAQGKPWLDRYLTKQRNVLLIDYESGETTVRRRVKKLKQGSNLEGLYYKRKNLAGLHDRETWQELHKFVQEKNIGLVVVDSIAGGSGAANENEQAFAAPFKQAGLAFENTAFIFIHHARKKQPGGADSENMRGTSALKAAMDTVYNVSEPEGDPTVGLRFRVQLDKIGESGQEHEIPIFLAPDPGGIQLDIREPRPTIQATSPVELDKQVLLKLKGYGAEGCAGAATLARDMGYIDRKDEKAVVRALKRMQESGLTWTTDSLHPKTNKKVSRWFA